MYCKKCGAEIQDKAKYCPNCGTERNQETLPIVEQIKDEEKDNQMESSGLSIEQKARLYEASQGKTNVNPVLKENYSLGVKTTFIWSTGLSLITTLLYSFKGLIDSNKLVDTLVQGVFARPLVVLFIAFIFSLFFSPKANQIIKFNSASRTIMGILSIGELGRWFVIIGSGSASSSQRKYLA